MGDSSSPPGNSAKTSESWLAFQVAFSRLLSDGVRQELEAGAPGTPAGGVTGDLKKTVTEAVGAVLLETKILERLLERHLKKLGPGAAPASAGDEPPEALRQETGKAVKEYLSKNLGVLFQNEIRGVIQREIRAFLASDELKELMDEKFRLITTYLKNDVIPKTIQQEMARSSS